MKTMKMYNRRNEMRVGIYAQKSAEVTAVGDGLASEEVKSPVTVTENLKTDNPIESEEKNISEKYLENETKTTQMHQEKLERREDLLTTSDVEDNLSNQSSEEFFVSDAERDKLNKETKLEAFPRCEQYYGKERWDKALQTLQKLGYLNWEINTMFSALDQIPKKDLKRKSMERTTEPHQEVMNKKPLLDDDQKPIEEETVEESGVISGILLNENYSTFDLRANIGDASHPNFHILPENRTKLYLEFYKFLSQEECFQDLDPVPCSYFVNQTLMIECRNEKIIEHIDKNISRLNERLWPEADFVLLPRTSESKNIRICIPYPKTDVAEILEIIKKQNRLSVDKWKVNNSEKYEDGICLDVEVDGGTYLRLMQDQDDIFFLMKKATIKLPRKENSKRWTRSRIT